MLVVTGTGCMCMCNGAKLDGSLVAFLPHSAWNLHLSKKSKQRDLFSYWNVVDNEKERGREGAELNWIYIFQAPDKMNAVSVHECTSLLILSEDRVHLEQEFSREKWESQAVFCSSTLTLFLHIYVRARKKEIKHEWMWLPM